MSVQHDARVSDLTDILGELDHLVCCETEDDDPIVEAFCGLNVTDQADPIRVSDDPPITCPGCIEASQDEDFCPRHGYCLYESLPKEH